MSGKLNPNSPYGRRVNPYSSSSQYPLGPLLTNKQKAVRQFINDLNAIYDKIERQPPGFLHFLKHRELSITCKELMLDDKGLYASRFKPCFFGPASPDVKQHPPIFPEENRIYDDHQQAFNKMIDFHMKDKTEARQSVYLLCYEMNWVFDAYPRKGTKNDRRDLRSLTNWLPSQHYAQNAVFEDRFENTLFLSDKPSWSPLVAYIDTKDRPHVMFTMRHDTNTMREEILRGEALAIVAAMVTRLERFHFKGHAYIPVLAFSFFGSLRGRILQAYFNGTNVVIWKTEIYDFTVENASTLVNVFVQQMSNVPTGDTRTLEKTVEQQQKEKLSHR